MLRRSLACLCALALRAASQSVSAKVKAVAIDLIDAGRESRLIKNQTKDLDTNLAQFLQIFFTFST